VHVPVTYADVWEFWRKHQKLESSVDFVTVHILPYWENHPLPISEANAHTRNIMTLLSHEFKKPILIGETGWPAKGRERNGSLPSKLNQARYIRNFLVNAKQLGWNYNLIEAFDQPWKRKLEGTVGGYWGIYNVDYTPKFPLTGKVSEQDDLATPLWAGLIGAVLFLLLGFAFKDYLQAQRVHFIHLGIMGVLTGLTGFLEISYLLTACRNQDEWIVLGGLMLASMLLLVYLSLYFVHPTKLRALSIRIFTWILSLGALGANYLLIIDGRYRDFPISLYAIPVVLLSLGFSVSRQKWNRSVLDGLLALTLVLSAIGPIYLEPKNHHAWVWLTVNVLLAYYLWPRKEMANSSSTSQQE
jgi:hypothetical protein